MLNSDSQSYRSQGLWWLDGPVSLANVVRTMERVQEVTYPKPLDELLEAAYVEYCTKVPWASDYALSPKSVLRDMASSIVTLQPRFA